MLLLNSLSLLLSASGLVAAFPMLKKNVTEKRYVIADNDWSTSGFIPFLMALDSDIELLALTSCNKLSI